MKFARTICALLLFSLIVSVLLVTVSAAKDDYSYPSATLTEDIFADEFIEDYIDGADLSFVESEYLRLQSGFLFSYNSNIPTSNVETSYENGTLSVIAREYKYVAENGVEVVWTPVSAVVDSQTKSFFGTDYTATFQGLSAEDGDSVKIEYRASFVISEEEINRLLNLAYNDAPRMEAEIAEKTEEYRELLAQYEIDVEKYSEYQSKLAVYNRYLEEKRIYDEALAKYNRYLNALVEYNKAQTAYEQYLIARNKYHYDLAEYEKYKAYAEQNQAKIEAYENYQEKYDRVLSQLDIIKKTKTPVTELKRTIYSAIMGSTVTEVIYNKGDIVAVLDGDADVVDAADEATKALRALLPGFFGIKNTEDQYKYYITNYAALRDNFVKLLQSLDALYSVDKVKAVIEAKEKKEKYLILIAQLYYIANALSDEPIKSYDGDYYYDENYQIGRSYKASERFYPSDLISEPFITDKNNAAPLEDGYPTAPEKPEYTTMAEPVMPATVPKPIEPEQAPKPTAPTVVPKPDEVQKPGKEPKPYVFPEETIAIIEAYNRGEISEREDYTGGDITISPSITVKKIFLGAEQVSVTYFDKEYTNQQNKRILYTVTVDKDTFADYLGEKPEKDEDQDYIYEHLGWTDGEGRVPDLSCVGEDLFLYPSFKAIQKEYNTYWVVGDLVLSENPGIPPLPNPDGFKYDFSGWEKSVNPITSDVTYTAKFDRPVLVIDGVPSLVRYENGTYVVEASASTNRYDVRALLDRAQGSGGITINTARGEQITISYSDTLKLYNAGVSEIFCSVQYLDGNTFELSAYDADGNKITDCDVKVGMKASSSISGDTHAFLYYKENGQKKYVQSEFADGQIGFLADFGRVYYARIEYTVNIPTLESVKISANKQTASVGEKVYINVETNNGIRLDGVYTVTPSGQKTYIENGVFAMPAEDVTVSVDYMILTYKVVFKSDGNTIVAYYHNYGDSVTLPQNPVKVSDGKFSYEFLGWSPEVDVVTGDVVYYAQYKATPIATDKGDNMEMSFMVKMVLLGISGVCCLMFVVLPSSIMTTVLIFKRKKHTSGRIDT